MGIIQALLLGLSTIAGPLAIRVLFSLGVGFLTFKGVDKLLDTIYASVQGYLNGLPGVVVEMVGVMNVDRFIELVFTAYTVKMALKGMQASGLFTKMTFGQSTGGT